MAYSARLGSAFAGIIADDSDLLPIRGYVLGLRIRQQPLVGALATDAGMLHAAERRSRIRGQPAVQPDHAAGKRQVSASPARHSLS